MKSIFPMLLLATIASLSFSPAYAEMGECSGIMHVTKGDIEFGGGKGETETICVVAEADKKKVLAACKAGAFCKVNGTVAACQDSGECTEISGVVSITRQH
ncbi:MAG TPA: hypothetical protein VGL34_23600 [Steroidobacteraceae bacterium]|jgi:hypothetical protein